MRLCLLRLLQSSGTNTSTTRPSSPHGQDTRPTNSENQHPKGLRSSAPRMRHRWFFRWLLGDTLAVQWRRFNHPGGFVRLAMVLLEESDSWSAFNSASYAKFSCYESNCGPDDPNDSYFGPMNGPGDGICSTSFKIPQDLPDGKVTLQWIWYGGGVYYGQPEAGFGEYYTCTDYIVQGGSDLVPKGSLENQKVWQGGDASNPGTDLCKYWSSNRIGDCSFGGQSPPNPRPDDLLSQSLEPCSRAGSFVGKAAEFEAGGWRQWKKRWGRGIRSDAYVNAKVNASRLA